MKIAEVYIGCLTSLYGPDAVSLEFFSNEGNILNLNFISAIAHRPNITKSISKIKRNGDAGIISPVIARYMIEATCITTRQTETNLFKAEIIIFVMNLYFVLKNSVLK